MAHESELEMSLTEEQQVAVDKLVYGVKVDPWECKLCGHVGTSQCCLVAEVGSSFAINIKGKLVVRRLCRVCYLAINSTIERLKNCHLGNSRLEL